MKKLYSLITTSALFAALLFSQNIGAQVLYDNGPYYNSTGTGANGANESVLYTTTFAMGTIGFGHQQTAFNRVADDFMITDCAWRIDSVVFFGYQTGSPTTSTFTAVNFRIWDSIPDVVGANVVYGDTTTNRMIRTAWSGAYRITETTTGNATRPIMRNVCSAGGIILTGGTYWFDWSSAGSLASGPWAPPRTPVQVAITGNGRQRTGNIWNNAVDGGTNTPAQGFPFIIYGTALNATADAGLASTFCVSGSTVLGGTPAGSGTGTLTYSWSPAAGLSNAAIANPTATVSATTSYVLTVTDSFGCAVMDTVTLTVNQPSASSITEIACGSYISPAGNTYTSTGIYTDTITNAAGCDSVITIDLTVNTVASGTISVNSCSGSYTSPAGNVYTSSGTYIDTLSTASGCDSIITINLSFNTATSSTIAPVACDSYTSPSGMVYTTNGTYLDTIPNMAGCDSVITINLTVNSASTTTVIADLCGGSYTAPSGAVYTVSGTYNDTIQRVNGCDSISQIYLTITTIDTSVTLLNNGYSVIANDSTPGATYLWVDCNNNFSPIANTQQFDNSIVVGNYAVIITVGNCSDTSNCWYVNAWGIEEQLAGAAIDLYPNPNNGSFMLDLGKPATDVALLVTDMTGRVIWTGTSQQAQLVPVQFDAPAGMYILTIQTENYRAVKSLMKSE
jgi:Secretion system C-terminal sorting domain